jgi:uncharacterized membrane protein YkvA (DUF1232 family)
MALYRRIPVVRNFATALRIATRPGSPSLMERISAVPRMVRATRSGEYTGISVGRLAMLAAAVGYVVSPIDLMPEGLLLVFGLADDAMVVSWIAATLVRETESFLEWERGVRPAEDWGATPAAGAWDTSRATGASDVTGAAAAWDTRRGGAPQAGRGEPTSSSDSTVQGRVVDRGFPVD